MTIEEFERCGLASLDDFCAPDYPALFESLETIQDEFLALETKFRSPEYRWERDVLHGWSRSWEYPYAFYHLTKYLLRCREAGGEAAPLTVDFGSGVTFFPFAVARRGFAVACVDNDPVAEKDVIRASQLMSASPGSVTFRLTGGATLPFRDAAVDVLYCISVLEHIANPLPVVSEIARVLKSGGLFILTIDLDLKGNSEIGPEKYAALLQLLGRYFAWEVPEVTVHPVRMLHSYAGPYPRARERQVPGIMWRAASGQLRPLIGGPIAEDPIRLACWGGVMRRLD